MPQSLLDAGEHAAVFPLGDDPGDALAGGKVGFALSISAAVKVRTCASASASTAAASPRAARLALGRVLG
jgi:hypothetical protein